MSKHNKQRYARRAPTKEPYDVVLIVCEGEKTEPSYFERLRVLHSLSNANIKITPADSSAPLYIVEFAQAEMKNHEYDRVFCVFDRDEHTTYAIALQKIADSTEGKSGKLKAITSWPCFEVWLWLHFEYSTAPFVRSGGRSPGENVKKKLKELYPD